MEKYHCIPRTENTSLVYRSVDPSREDPLEFCPSRQALMVKGCRAAPLLVCYRHLPLIYITFYKERSGTPPGINLFMRTFANVATMIDARRSANYMRQPRAEKDRGRVKFSLQYSLQRYSIATPREVLPLETILFTERID